MTTPGRGLHRLTERLRAILGQSRDVAPPAPRTRVSVASFERARGRVWVPPDPSRRWFEKQGIIPIPMDRPRHSRWWR